MFTLRRDDNGGEKGTYQVLELPTRRLVLVLCPACGGSARLDHDIADDGAVAQSLECSYQGCSFHETVRLDGWTGPGLTRDGKEAPAGAPR